MCQARGSVAIEFLVAAFTVVGLNGAHDQESGRRQEAQRVRFAQLGLKQPTGVLAVAGTHAMSPEALETLASPSPDLPMDYVSWWRFEEDAMDEARRNSGQLRGDACIVRDTEKGRVLSLDGNRAYVEIPNSPSLGSLSSVTLAAWVKIRGLTDGKIIVRPIADGRDPWEVYALDVRRSGGLRFVLSNGEPYSSGGWQSTSIPSPLLNVWHHLAGTYHGGTFCLYLDGILVHSRRVDITIAASDEPTLIGRYRAGESIWGYLDDVMVYERALEECDIQRLYQAQRPRTGKSQARAVQAAICSAIDGSMCSNGAVIGEIIHAAASGSIVQLPEGCFEVEGCIELPEGVNVMGAGMARTILCRDPIRCQNQENPIFQVSGDGGGGATTRISNIAFVGVPRDLDRGWDIGIRIRGSALFRVDHCYLQDFGLAGIQVSGESVGVIDNCLFVDNYKPSIGNVGYGVLVLRDNHWEEDMKIGTAEATFVENCRFVGSRHAIAANGGAHYVFRHNDVADNAAGHAVDAHGPCCGSDRGTRCVEIYENTIRKPQRNEDLGIMIRGGGGVVFDNVFEGYPSPLVIAVEDADTECSKPYPRLDQVGDLWFWGNVAEGEPVAPVVYLGAMCGSLLMADRDYFTREKPGYRPLDYPHPLRNGE